MKNSTADSNILIEDVLIACSFCFCPDQYESPFTIPIVIAKAGKIPRYKKNILKVPIASGDNSRTKTRGRSIFIRAAVPDNIEIGQCDLNLLILWLLQLTNSLIHILEEL